MIRGHGTRDQRRRHTAVGTLIAIGLIVFAATGAWAQDETGSTEAEKKKALFPLMQHLVKDRPELPPPYGAALLGNWVNSEWNFTSAMVGINDPNVPVQAAPDCDANINASTIGPKLDLWVLPFLDVFLVGGYATTDIQLLLRNVPLAFDPPNGAVRGDVITEFTLEGTFVTVGAAFAGGYRKFFSTVDLSMSDVNFGKKDLVVADQDFTYSVAVRIGYQLGLTQFWGGTRYLDGGSHYVGTIAIPTGNNFTFDVGLETAAWNFTTGMRTVHKGHWEGLLEVGIGARHMMTASVGYRW